jgi:hypothetical protein
VTLYMCGLSYRQAETILWMLDCRGSKSSIERDVAQAGQKAREFHQAAPRMRVRVLGVDGTGAAMAGVNAGVVFFVDLEGQRLIGVEPVHEEHTLAVRRHVTAVGAGELRTDEHSVYERIVPEAQHRICLAHWAKSKGKRAYDLHRQAVAEGRPLEEVSKPQSTAAWSLRPPRCGSYSNCSASVRVPRRCRRN